MGEEARVNMEEGIIRQRMEATFRNWEKTLVTVSKPTQTSGLQTQVAKFCQQTE
jgi:hypothetical protein